MSVPGSWPAGQGKTVMALHFIREGAVNGEPGLFVGFQENPAQVARLMQSLGWDAARLLDGVHFEHVYRSPVEMPLDRVAAEIFERVKHRKVRRVAIDALGDLERLQY